MEKLNTRIATLTRNDGKVFRASRSFQNTEDLHLFIPQPILPRKIILLMTLCKLKLKKKQRYISLCMMFVSIHHQWLQVWFAGAFFCIDMGNIVFIHMMKIHLPNMYIIFECHTVENKYVALFYNTPKLSTFRIISDSLKLFAPNSLGPFQLLHFLLFF